MALPIDSKTERVQEFKELQARIVNNNKKIELISARLKEAEKNPQFYTQRKVIYTALAVSLLVVAIFACCISLLLGLPLFAAAWCANATGSAAGFLSAAAAPFLGFLPLKNLFAEAVVSEKSDREEKNRLEQINREITTLIQNV